MSEALGRVDEEDVKTGRLRFRILVSSLTALSPAALAAQEKMPPPPSDEIPARAAPVADDTGRAPGPGLPPNVTITTPDGKPLPPELLQQVLEALKADPKLRTTLDRATIGTVRTNVNDTDIVVTAVRPRGSVPGDVPPTRTLNPLDIRAYGARDINGLISSLGGEVSSVEAAAPRQPIVLLNGRRIANFEEIAGFPTEAIERLEVFPEELALQYGFAANRKVVNLVTFDPFTSKNVAVSFGVPTAGGRSNVAANGRYLRLVGASRFSLSLGFDRATRVLESERDLVQPAEALSQARFRTLLPDSRQWTLNGSFSKEIFTDTPLTLTGNATSARKDSLLGLGVSGPLRQKLVDRAASMGATLSGRLPGWFWFSRTNYNIAISDALTDVAAAGGETARTRSAASSLSTDISLTGSLFSLPAGSVSATLRAEYSLNLFDSRGDGDALDQQVDLVRNRGIVFGSLDVPLARRHHSAPSWLGSLSANAHFGLEQITAFHSLLTYGYGVYWSPVEPLRFTAMTSVQQTAPSLEQLGSVAIVTPNVRTFDYVRGETVDIAQTFGGNPRLRPDDRKILNIGVVVKPPRGNFNVIANFTRTTVDRPIAAFPIPTQPVQAAFPERLTRASNGRLLRIDSSPINLFRSARSDLRWGINMTRSLGKLPDGTDLIVSPVTDGTIPPGTLPPNSRVIDNPPGTPLPPEIENAISRVYFSLYHSWRLSEAVVLSSGGPTLDLLDGFALDSLGRPRHEIEFAGGLFRRGLGARMNIRWESASVVRGLPSGTGPTGTRLRFSRDLSADLSLFLNPEERIVGEVPGWIRNLQLALDVKNILNSRPVVRNEFGEVPLNYQKAYLDPVGRSITFSIRKLF
ncbi:MAG: hypothetical protein WBR13_04115 [Allosphingosinicella sp.]